MSKIARLLRSRMHFNNPKQVRNIMFFSWSFFVFGSLAVATFRFLLGAVSFERAFGSLGGAIVGVSIATATVTLLSYITQKGRKDTHSS